MSGLSSLRLVSQLIPSVRPTWQEIDMGAALYITLENEDAGVDNFVDGKALSRVEDHLVAVAHELGVRPLMEFYSMSEEDFLEEARQFNTLAGVTDPSPYQEQWFTAEEGLSTLRALLSYVQRTRDAFVDADSVIVDLQNFVDVLEEAASRGIRWHLSVDY